MHSERQNERESGSKKVYKLSFQFTSEISPMHSEKVKVRKNGETKKVHIVFTAFSAKKSAMYSERNAEKNSQTF